ncbi:MAG: ABC transporter ATP-binding protein [Caulobacterales bacterium]|uniref:ABC transporter ATP-binding protein n=1 Tax=Glycocaulis sp. TaxID=1969725 RepID=UPI003F9FAE33
MTNRPAAISVRGARFAYARKAPIVLDIEAFDVAAGEKVFLKGASGSGKSTLLGLIAGIMAPTAGSISVLGQPMSEFPGARRDALRAERLGVIFQMFNLLPYLPAGANVMLPARFSAQRNAACREAGGAEAEARRLMGRLQLDPERYWSSPPTALSVGQQQRVAAARALIGRPGLVLADEPTSALDADSRDAFLSLLIEECSASGAALLFVSHDGSLASRFDRAIDLSQINLAGVRA